MGVETVSNATNLNATLFPNPASNQVGIKLEGDFNKDRTIEIYLSDMTGRRIASLYQGKAGQLPAAFKLPAIAAGTYMVTINYENKRIKSLPLAIK